MNQQKKIDEMLERNWWMIAAVKSDVDEVQHGGSGNVMQESDRQLTICLDGGYNSARMTPTGDYN